MSTDQEYWDACLIKTWRNMGSVGDVLHMFAGITQKRNDQVTLLRNIPTNIPWKVPLRAFVAERLPKISERLWNQTPEKDVALLRKLQTSPYDTATTNLTPDNERLAERRKTKKNQSIIDWNLTNALKRNQATDWNVTKGGRIKRIH